jgi:hypothetical protein
MLAVRRADQNVFKIKCKLMKKILIAIALLVVATACNTGENYKKERDEVMKFHDVVMEDQGKIVNNQMKIDSLQRDLELIHQKFPMIDTLKEKQVMRVTIERLEQAEALMNDWMHKFEPDITGKSNEEAVAYFKAERLKIKKIDSLYKAEIKASDAYLTKFHRK